MKKNIANLITCFRIVFSVLMLFFESFSVPFYLLYSFCGITDIADGFFARKLHSESEFGAKLDSIADAVFFAICTIILPKTLFASWVIVIFGIVLLIRLFNIVLSKKLLKKIVFLHTTANKITGLFLFCFVYVIRSDFSFYFAVIISAFAVFSSLQETYLLHKAKK